MITKVSCDCSRVADAWLNGLARKYEPLWVCLNASVDDAARLAQGPTFRLIGSHKVWERRLRLTLHLQSFQTEVLTREEHPQVWSRSTGS